MYGQQNIKKDHSRVVLISGINGFILILYYLHFLSDKTLHKSVVCSYALDVMSISYFLIWSS